MISRLAVWCCVALLFTGVAWCQSTDFGKPRHVRADVYGGYSRVGPSPFYQTPADQGGGFGGDVYLLKWLAVAGEADWMHVTYDAEDKARSVTVLGGPRLFVPIGSHRLVIPFVDFMGGAFTYGNPMGFNNPFTGTVSPAFAVDGGADVRIAGPVYVRVQGGYLHSSFTVAYPVQQGFLNNQHSRLLVEGVWRF